MGFTSAGTHTSTVEKREEEEGDGEEESTRGHSVA